MLCCAPSLWAFLVACPSDFRQKLPIAHHRPCFTFTSLAKGSRRGAHAHTTVRDVTKTRWKHCVPKFYEWHIKGHDRLVVHTVSSCAAHLQQEWGMKRILQCRTCMQVARCSVYGGRTSAPRSAACLETIKPHSCNRSCCAPTHGPCDMAFALPTTCKAVHIYCCSALGLGMVRMVLSCSAFSTRKLRLASRSCARGPSEHCKFESGKLC